MAQQRTLWRLQGGSPRDPAAWTNGLRLHLQHGAVTTIAMRIGAQQQCYLALIGCGQCLRDACQPGCYVMLLRRLIESTLPDGQLIMVPTPQGLALRPYTHAYLLWPHAQAHPLDLSLLSFGPEARLTLHWQYAAGQFMLGGVLSTMGAPTQTLLQSAGWGSLRIPSILMHRFNRVAFPPRLPGLPYRNPPFLLSTAQTTTEHSTLVNQPLQINQPI